MPEVIEYESTINGIVTNIGLKKCQEAVDNDGWHITAKSFGISDIKGELSSHRVEQNELWYIGSISSRRVIDANTIEFICNLPPNAHQVSRQIQEIYLFAEDRNRDGFVLYIGQPTGLEFNPNVAIKFRIIINILNVDMASIYKFQDTIAMDLEEHNNDPNAHEDIRNLIQATVGSTTIVTDPVYQAKSGDIIYVNTKSRSININLPTSGLSNKDRVTVIDVGLYAHVNYVVIKGMGNTIDGCTADFIFDRAGAAVTLYWYASSKSWRVDTGGRNGVPPFSASSTKALYYSNYFSSGGLQAYSPVQDYPKNSITVGSDHMLYLAVVNTGPSYGGAKDPVDTNQTSWVPLAKRTKQTITSAITKDSAVTILGYCKGANQLDVYIQGLHALEGTDANTCTYYEDKSVSNGARATKIYFHDDIPANFGIEIYRG